MAARFSGGGAESFGTWALGGNLHRGPVPPTVTFYRCSVYMPTRLIYRQWMK